MSGCPPFLPVPAATRSPRAYSYVIPKISDDPVALEITGQFPREWDGIHCHDGVEDR
jgi:hypothetical protein